MEAESYIDYFCLYKQMVEVVGRYLNSTFSNHL